MIWTGPHKKGGGNDYSGGEVDGVDKLACRAKEAKENANMTICEFM